MSKMNGIRAIIGREWAKTKLRMLYKTNILLWFQNVTQIFYSWWFFARILSFLFFKDIRTFQSLQQLLEYSISVNILSVFYLKLQNTLLRKLKFIGEWILSTASLPIFIRNRETITNIKRLKFFRKVNSL